MNIALIVVLCIVAAAVIAFFVRRGVRHYRLIKKVEEQTGVKVKRRTVMEWLRAHKPSKRRLVQLYATLLYNANIKGFIKGSIYTSPTTKYMCVPGLNCYSCPGAVGACPLGALQNALAESSVRAPYYVLGILAILGLILARTICGWLCPVGLGQELLYKIRTPKLKKSRVTRVLSYFKYVLLIALVVILPIIYSLRDIPLPAFCKYICPAGTFGGAIGLLMNPSNASMFGMLGGQFAWKFAILIGFIVASIFIFRFFCRFFCPLGAIYGFFNRIALIGVKVDKNNCTNCGKCVTVCKMDIKRVGDHECINCGKCIPVCPTKAIYWKGSKMFLHKQDIPEQKEEVAPPVILNASSKPTINPTAGIENAYISEPTLNVSTETAATDNQLPETSVAVAKEPKKKKRDKAFWVQLTAWIAATALLIGALVYYNFIDVDKPQASGDENTGYSVGELAPDFTVKLYGSDESFTLYDNRGKLTVINFWATWCTPCVQELPYFDALAANYPDINVIAIHTTITRPVQAYIDEHFSDCALTFAQDNIDGSVSLTYKALGGTSTMPLTVIVDADGYVVFNESNFVHTSNSFHSYAELEELVTSFMQNE